MIQDRLLPVLSQSFQWNGVRMTTDVRLLWAEVGTVSVLQWRNCQHVKHWRAKTLTLHDKAKHGRICRPTKWFFEKRRAASAAYDQLPFGVSVQWTKRPEGLGYWEETCARWRLFCDDLSGGEEVIVTDWQSHGKICVLSRKHGRLPARSFET